MRNIACLPRACAVRAFAALLLCAATAGAQGASPAFVTFSDQAAFVAATGATSATGPLPNAGFVGSASSLTVGSVTFSSFAPSSLVFGTTDWTTRLPGIDLAINDRENLNAVFAAPVYSAGFAFVEPQSDPLVNGPFIDSTFTVTLKAGGSTVGSFNFNAPNDAAAFVGVWSDTAFSALEIRETVGGIGNEFFGEFYTGTVAVPEPETYALMLAGLGLLGFAARRRRRLKEKRSIQRRPSKNGDDRC